MVDCSGRFFDKRHDQFLKDGDTMAFLVEMADFWLSAIDNICTCAINNGE